MNNFNPTTYLPLSYTIPDKQEFNKRKIQEDMKIKLNKDHLTHKAGDEIEVTPQEGEYFRRMGMVWVTAIIDTKPIINNITHHEHAKRGRKAKH